MRNLHCGIWPRRLNDMHPHLISCLTYPTLWTVSQKSEWRAAAPDILRREPPLLMSDTSSVKILWKVSNPYAWYTYSINNWTRAPLLLFVVQNIIPISSRLRTFNQFSLTLEMLVEDGFTRVSQKTLFLNFVSAVEPLVRTSSRSPPKIFQRKRPINDTWRAIWNFGLI